MKLVFRVKFKWIWRSFWKRPEWTTFCSQFVQGIDMEQLQDVVSVEFVEFDCGSFDAIIKSHWFKLCKFDRFLDIFPLSELLKSNLIHLSTLMLVKVLRIYAEHHSKHVFSPFNTVKCFLWEHLKCAVRDLFILFWVFLRAICLCPKWNYDLDMTFGSKCATIQQWNSCLNTLVVNV